MREDSQYEQLVCYSCTSCELRDADSYSTSHVERGGQRIKRRLKDDAVKTKSERTTQEKNGDCTLTARGLFCWTSCIWRWRGVTNSGSIWIWWSICAGAFSHLKTLLTFAKWSDYFSHPQKIAGAVHPATLASPPTGRIWQLNGGTDMDHSGSHPFYKSILGSSNRSLQFSKIILDLLDLSLLSVRCFFQFIHGLTTVVRFTISFIWSWSRWYGCWRRDFNTMKHGEKVTVSENLFRYIWNHCKSRILRVPLYCQGRPSP